MPVPEDKFIAEFDTSLKVPVKYVLQTLTKPFGIYLYLERNLTSGERDLNSDIPAAVWTPKEGLHALSHSYNFLRHAGLDPVVIKFCKRAFEAWKEE
jgi:hypothetical protein